MSKMCEITGRRTRSGNNRSHALNSTKRKIKANLQKRRVRINGKEKNIYISARALKSGKYLKKYNIELV